MQVLTNHADGHVLSDDEVADFYMRAHDFGMRHGVVPSFEVHVNMWSEHFGRVEKVAALVRSRGVPFYMTLDHSHVIFKMDNPEEQKVQDMQADLESGALILIRRDPATLPGGGSTAISSITPMPGPPCRAIRSIRGRSIRTGASAVVSSIRS
ncbi:MAG: hypothetical protein U1E70_00305 [Acetobacteraceae bacterium]